MLCTCMNPHPPKAHPEELEVLAGALDDTPESVISVHLLAGDPTRPDGIIVQGGSDPGQRMSFGSDAAVM